MVTFLESLSFETTTDRVADKVDSRREEDRDREPLIKRVSLMFLRAVDFLVVVFGGVHLFLDSGC